MDRLQTTTENILRHLESAVAYFAVPSQAVDTPPIADVIEDIDQSLIALRDSINRCDSNTLGVISTGIKACLSNAAVGKNSRELPSACYVVAITTLDQPSLNVLLMAPLVAARLNDDRRMLPEDRDFKFAMLRRIITEVPEAADVLSVFAGSALQKAAAATEPAATHRRRHPKTRTNPLIPV